MPPAADAGLNLMGPGRCASNSSADSRRETQHARDVRNGGVGEEDECVSTTERENVSPREAKAYAGLLQIEDEVVPLWAQGEGYECWSPGCVAMEIRQNAPSSPIIPVEAQDSSLRLPPSKICVQSPKSSVRSRKNHHLCVAALRAHRLAFLTLASSTASKDDIEHFLQPSASTSAFGAPDVANAGNHAQKSVAPVAQSKKNLISRIAFLPPGARVKDSCYALRKSTILDMDDALRKIVWAEDDAESTERDRNEDEELVHEHRQSAAAVADIQDFSKDRGNNDSVSPRAQDVQGAVRAVYSSPPNCGIASLRRPPSGSLAHINASAVHSSPSNCESASSRRPPSGSLSHITASAVRRSPSALSDNSDVRALHRSPSALSDSSRCPRSNRHVPNPRLNDPVQSLPSSPPQMLYDDMAPPVHYIAPFAARPIMGDSSVQKRALFAARAIIDDEHNSMHRQGAGRVCLSHKNSGRSGAAGLGSWNVVFPTQEQKAKEGRDASVLGEQRLKAITSVQACRNSERDALLPLLVVDKADREGLKRAADRQTLRLQHAPPEGTDRVAPHAGPMRKASGLHKGRVPFGGLCSRDNNNGYNMRGVCKDKTSVPVQTYELCVQLDGSEAPSKGIQGTIVKRKHASRPLPQRGWA